MEHKLPIVFWNSGGWEMFRKHYFLKWFLIMCTCVCLCACIVMWRPEEALDPQELSEAGAANWALFSTKEPSLLPINALFKKICACGNRSCNNYCHHSVLPGPQFVLRCQQSYHHGSAKDRGECNESNGLGTLAGKVHHCATQMT